MNIASWSDDVLVTTLGRVWINYDNLEQDIEFKRELWVEHLAIVAAFNLFWVMILHCILSFFVKMYMKDSLRREIDPDAAREGDFMARRSLGGSLRRCCCPSGFFSY